MATTFDPNISAPPTERSRGTRNALRWLSFGTDKLFYAVITLIVLFLVVVPLGVMLISSFRTGRLGVTPGVFTLQNWVTAYSSPTNIKAMVNSFIYATGSLIVTFAIAAPMAWAATRTNMPGRRLVFPAMMVPVAIPGMLFAIAWILLLSPKIGLVNTWLAGILGWFGFHIDKGPINIYSMGGMIFLDGIRHIPTIFLILAGAFRNMDASLDEASTVSGAGIFSTFRRISLPVLTPAILGAAIYSFIGSLESFEIPGLLGLPAGIYVFSTRIYFVATSQVPPDIGTANAFAMTFLAISLVLLWFYRKATRNAEAYATITGKGFKAREVDLGKWRWIPTAVFAIYFFFVVILPLFILAWASGHKYFQEPSLKGMKTWSLDNYRTLINLPSNMESVKNTLFLMLAAATLTMILSFATSWISVRGKFRGARWLDSVAFLPHTVPGIVIGLTLLVLYLGPLHFLGIYGTLWVVVIAMITKYLAFGTRNANAALLQVHKELEEASEISGASPVRTLRSVVFPLITPAFVTGWIWVAMHAIRELSMALMLATNSNKIVSTRLWSMWIDGKVGQAAALGVVLTIVLAVLVVVGEFIGRRLQKSGDGK